MSVTGHVILSFITDGLSRSRVFRVGTTRVCEGLSFDGGCTDLGRSCVTVPVPVCNIKGVWRFYGGLFLNKVVNGVSTGGRMAFLRVSKSGAWRFYGFCFVCVCLSGGLSLVGSLFGVNGRFVRLIVRRGRCCNGLPWCTHTEPGGIFLLSVLAG